jgi:hypothetical protein
MADGYALTKPTDAGAPLIAGAVEGVLNYLSPIPDKPHTYNYEPPAGVPRQNFENEAHRVLIEDLRGRESSFTTDGQGFAAVRHRSRERDFEDDAAIRNYYYPESEALLAELLGAHRVLIFDHTIRRRLPGQSENSPGARQPVARVHVDQTDLSGVERVRRHLPDEADSLLAGRVRIVNLWRPIRGPVLDHPLATADGGSLAPPDLVATDLLYPERTGETYSVTFNPAHRWYYWSGMQPDEVLLLKCYDSARDGRVRLSPHTAFADPRVDASAPPRQSIELRALVFGG